MRVCNFEALLGCLRPANAFANMRHRTDRQLGSNRCCGGGGGSHYCGKEDYLGLVAAVRLFPRFCVLILGLWV
jgi:hypothetical protein